MAEGLRFDNGGWGSSLLLYAPKYPWESYLGYYTTKLLRFTCTLNEPVKLFSASFFLERGEPPDAGPAGKFFLFKSGQLSEL